MINVKQHDRVSGDRVVVPIRGRINIDNSDGMRRTLRQALRSKPAQMAVDMSEVTYIDISGLATLVEAARIARGQGTRIILGGIQGQTLNLLEMTRLDQLFEMETQEAIS